MSRKKIDVWRYISSLGQQDDPKHNELRRILAEGFLPKRIEELRPKIERTAMTCIDRMLEATPPVDLHAKFALPIPSRVIIELMGMPPIYRRLFQENVDILVSDTIPTGQKITAVLAKLYTLCERLFEQDEAVASGSMFVRIKSGVNAGQLSQEEACRLIVSVTGIGHGLTASSISLGALMLLLNPELLRAMRDEPGAVHNILEEMLRHHSPINYGLPRVATEDVLVGGTLISKGGGVIVSLSSANRDDSVFSDPDKFDITRSEARRHVSFGYGTHVCLGQWVARAELEIALSLLVTRIPTLRLAVPLEEISFTDDSYIFTVNKLPVTW